MLIGLTGRAQVGKDTAYELIHRNFNSLDRPVIQKSFAQMLKISAASLFEIPPSKGVEWANMIKGDGWSLTLENFSSIENGRRYTMTGREFLQRYGTEAHRNLFGGNFWVDALFPQSMSPEAHEKQIWIVTDVRFSNEAKRIKDLGGEVWQITRKEVEGKVDTHASEQQIHSWLIDTHFVNNGTLEEYEQMLCDSILRRLDTKVAV